MRRLSALFFTLLWAFWGVGAEAQTVASVPRQAQLSLVADRESVAPGEAFTLGLRQVLAPGWHVYWLNPGDAGLPMRLEWTLPEGFSVGQFQWPTPRIYATVAGDVRLVNYVYEREVILPFSGRAPEAARPGDVLTLSAKAFYLVCDDKTCVPEESEVALDLPVAAQGASSGWNEALSAAQATVPRPWAGVAASLDPSGRLSVADGELSRLLAAGVVRDAHFFPFSQTALDHNAPQRPERGDRGLSFALAPPFGQREVAAPLEGVVGFDLETPQGWVRQGILVSAVAGPLLSGTTGTALGAAPSDTGAFSDDADSEGASPSMGLGLALLFAFLGGLILNVMPCVLPILSVKALGLVHGAQNGLARRHGVLFVAGVMTMFLGLAGILIALQAGGAAAGWGFQLQEPWFMGALAALFFLIGLNLLGAFEIGAGVQNVGAGLARRSGDLGAFFTGVLAVTAATPCTAPFMASAIGYAAAQPPLTALLVFAALGFGFALPFAALSFAPGLQRFLPRPGPWMERFKQTLAFPMFAAAAWAAWVLVGQVGADGLLALSAVLIAFGLLVWGFRAFSGLRGRAVTAAFAVAMAVFGATVARPPPVAAEAWTPERVAVLQAEGRTVFVNFTADWCVTCQVNERTALGTPEFVRTLRAIDAAYLVADWTRRDPVIAETLALYGRDGVPLYLVYHPGRADPVILPQILTARSVARALNPN
jgi:thiol:disulfide interchange protein/DsbC/DsbD-like thiol-disulfide interchange protein